MSKIPGEVAGEKANRGKEDFSVLGPLPEVTLRHPGPWPRAAGGLFSFATLGETGKAHIWFFVVVVPTVLRCGSHCFRKSAPVGRKGNWLAILGTSCIVSA